MRAALSIAIGFVYGALVSCGGGRDSFAPPSSDAKPSAVSVTAEGSSTIVSGTTLALTAVVTNKGGVTLSSQPIDWSTSDTSIAKISSLGVVTGARVGQASIRATSGGVASAPLVVTVTPGAAAALGIQTQPTGAASGVAFPTQPVIEIRDAAGNFVAAATNQVTATIATGGGTLTGTTSVNADGGVARFTNLTVVGSDGSRTLTFSAAGLVPVTSAAINIGPPPATGLDFAVTDVQFTQAVQSTAGTIPIVLSGRAAVVNVLIRASAPSTTPMQVVLRLFSAAGAPLRTDTAVVTTLGTATSFEAPSVQFLVPASVLQSGMRWQVVRDPRQVVPDDVPANDVFPATGTSALATVTVPPLKIRFVPIVLSAHGNATGQVNDAQLTEYLRTVRSVHPLGSITATIGAPFATSASFGTPPSGGGAQFWTQVLGELDLARIADPTASDTHWYGVIVPPAGFNYTVFGGFAYIPSSYQSSGANTRTALGVQLNWFSRPTQARDLVAHELGHNFGRSHTPCGGPAGIDQNYPVPGGTLDNPGHDVYSWENGLATRATVVPVSTGDLMGYCAPSWASAYTYQGVLAFRGSALAAQASSTVLPARRTRVLVIRGSETRGQMRIEPVFALTGVPSIPAAGAYRVSGYDASGAVLFTHSIELTSIDHAPDVHHFTVAIPATPALEASLYSIRVAGPGGEARVTRASPSASLAAPGTARVSEGIAVKSAGGLVSASCTDPSTRGILVLDDATGTVLAISSTPVARATSGAASVTVLCSDGVSTTTTRGVQPN